MIQDEIMKLQTYKMFEGDSDVYVMREDVLEVLKNYIDLTDSLKKPIDIDICPIYGDTCPYPEKDCVECERHPKKTAIDVDMLREIKLHNKESEDIKNA